jgi:hypothetical protein
MYNEQYATISETLTDTERSLLVKALDVPITTTTGVSRKLVSLGLLTLYSGFSPAYFTTTDLGYSVATWIQSLFIFGNDQEVYDSNLERWKVVFEVSMPKPYGSFMAIETFRDQVMVSEALESRAISLGHSMMRSRYQTASRIRVISREVYQLPLDMGNIIQFQSPSSSSSSE